MSDIQIVDNFLSDEAAKELREYIMGNYFPWFFSPYVASKNDKDNNSYFTHTFYDNYRVNSDFFKLLSPILTRITAKSLIRCRANLYPNIGKLIEHKVHTDFPYPHKGVMYYINTNDGYTGFEDGTKVESIANRAMFFNPSIPHFSTTCSDQKARVNISINFF